jgi:hypothetical protein
MLIPPISIRSLCKERTLTAPKAGRDDDQPDGVVCARGGEEGAGWVERERCCWEGMGMEDLEKGLYMERKKGGLAVGV